MNIYGAAGFRDFVVALGYKGEVLKDYFLNFHIRNSDFAVNLRDGKASVSGRRAPDWQVQLVDTGLATMTGGRLRRLQDVLGNETFMVTYGDGVANIDVADLVRFHRSHGRVATLTAVRPQSRFGSLVVDDAGVVAEFIEKPQVSDGWINGGFFVFEPAIFAYLGGDASVLEREPIEALVRDGQLAAYRLESFWQPMDTLREKRLLDDLWQSGTAPWKVWAE
jgi:glucose-1-phosphate cytidylyltransferase